MQLPQWHQLMQDLNFDENTAEFMRIKALYSGKTRHYHSATHIADCLQKASWQEVTRTNYALQLAIWYHDVVYNAFRKDNELKSAEQAVTFLTKQAADSALKTKVFDLIMATIHKNPPRNEEEACLMDIDITILGANPSDYQKYCELIRKEYSWVPSFLYRKKRAEVMTNFLAREQLYHTSFFRERYEEQARKNIKQELEML